MDAKPQRLRPLRVHDENMPPQVLPAKTLHQRTKSVPALSTMSKEAVKKAFAVNEPHIMKRVLGEVNPNAKLQQAAKDDLSVAKKGVIQKEASVLVKTDWKAYKDNLQSQITAVVAPPLSRPALRPQVSKNFSAPIAPTVAAVDTKPVLLPKKSVKVLKDEPVPKLSEISTAVPSLPLVTKTEVVVQTHSVEVNTTAEVKTAVKEEKPLVACPLASQQDLPVSAPLQDRIAQIGDPDIDFYALQVLQQEPPIAPYANVGPMPEQYYPAEEYEAYDDYSTRQSFGLSGESTAAFTTIGLPKPSEKTKVEIEAAKRYVEALRTADDIDDELWDTSMVAEYGDEIFSYMRVLEERLAPNPRYMDIQTEVQWSMRAVLVDWVVQVHQRFNLLPETLFLAVNYIDRFLSNKVVSLGKLQLVGATALFIAAKFEEVNCPTLQEVIFMVDGGYTVDELLKAERFMLSMLKFDLGWPGPMSFLRRVSKADDYDLETRTLAKYFLEVTIMDERFLGCTPSFLAAGAHCLARLMLRKGDWSIAHVAYSEFTYAQLRPVVQGITECCQDARRHHLSVFEKYTDKRYKYASTFVEGELMKGFSLHPRLSVRSSFGTPAMTMNAFT